MINEAQVRELTADEAASVDGGVFFLVILAAPAVLELAAGIVVGGAAVAAGIYLAETD